MSLSRAAPDGASDGRRRAARRVAVAGPSRSAGWRRAAARRAAADRARADASSGSTTSSPAPRSRSPMARCIVAAGRERSATLAGALDLDSTVPPIRGHVHLPIKARCPRSWRRTGRSVTSTSRSAAMRVSSDPATPRQSRPRSPVSPLTATGSRRSRRCASRGSRPDRTVASRRQVDGHPRAAPLVAFDGTRSMRCVRRARPALADCAVAPAVADVARGGRPARASSGAVAQLGLHPAPAGAAAGATPPAPNALRRRLRLHGRDRRLSPPLEPIRAAAGAARLTGERLDVTVRAGAIGAAGSTGGTLGWILTVDPPAPRSRRDVAMRPADVLTLDRAATDRVRCRRSRDRRQGRRRRERVHAELRLPIATCTAASAVNVRATAALTARDAAAGSRPASASVTGGSTCGSTGRRSRCRPTALTNLPALTTPVTLALTVASDPAWRRAPGE